MALHQDPQDNFSATGRASGAGSTSLTASQAGAAGYIYAVTHISGSSDLASQLALLDGTTTKWQIGIPANVPFSIDLTEPILLTNGAAAGVNVGTGSLSVSANVAGYRIAKV